jgi:flagellar protein FlgJ
MAYQPVTRAELRAHTGPRPGTRALHDVLIWMFHSRGVRSGGIYNRRAVRGGTSWSLHAVGRALDIMVPVGDPVGWEIALRVIRHADALGVAEVIHDRKRWTAEKGTQPYRGSNPHRDHVHIGMTVDMADRPDTPQLRQWMAHFVGLTA